jgi:hypothetical protein
VEIELERTYDSAGPNDGPKLMVRVVMSNLNTGSLWGVFWHYDTRAYMQKGHPEMAYKDKEIAKKQGIQGDGLSSSLYNRWGGNSRQI